MTRKGVSMKKELFEELVESVKQGAVMKGKMKSSRSTEFPESEVRKIRAQLRFISGQIRVSYGNKCSHTPQLGARST
jgi:hypothetical protein